VVVYHQIVGPQQTSTLIYDGGEIQAKFVKTFNSALLQK